MPMSERQQRTDWTQEWGPLIAATAEKQLCAGSADSGTPDVQSGGGGARPTSALFDSEWRRACRVVAVDDRTVVAPMIRHHYLGKWPGVVLLTLAMVRDGDLLGVVVFAAPPRETEKRYGGTTWELARLWVDDSVPRNAESWLLARAAAHVRRNHPAVIMLVSYADPSKGHEGTIYRAAGWRADGWTDQGRLVPRCDYVDSTGKHYSRRAHVPDGVKVRRVARQPKYRFKLRLRTAPALLSNTEGGGQ
jgi:hypothetical protein